MAHSTLSMPNRESGVRHPMHASHHAMSSKIRKKKKCMQKENVISFAWIFFVRKWAWETKPFPSFLALDWCRFEPGVESGDFLGYCWSVL